MEAKEAKVLIKYIRTKWNKPIGVVVAVDRNKIGWSACHKNDQWDREKAKTIAIERAWLSRPISKLIEAAPYHMKEVILEMKDRADKYYQSHE